MSDPRGVYFVVRSDEKGPPGGPYLTRALAERMARVHEDDCWLLEVDAFTEFWPRPLATQSTDTTET